MSIPTRPAHGPSGNSPRRLQGARVVLAAAVLLPLVATTSVPARARGPVAGEAFPVKPLRLVVPFPPPAAGTTSWGARSLSASSR